MKKACLMLIVLGLFIFPGNVLAHVTVKPDSAGIGSFQTFNVSVPSEKDTATVEVRLEFPMELRNVTPTVKQGWTIEVKTHLMDGEEHPYEIVWKGGRIPGHHRDDFSFSAQVPSKPTTIEWKAYQKYSDGSVISWVLGPSAQQPMNEDGSPDFSEMGPLTKTEVIDDLNSDSEIKGSGNNTLNMALSGSALLVALASFVVRRRG